MLPSESVIVHFLDRKNRGGSRARSSASLLGVQDRFSPLHTPEVLQKGRRSLLKVSILPYPDPCKPKDLPWKTSISAAPLSCR
jgi:hypothetical protein